MQWIDQLFTVSNKNVVALFQEIYKDRKKFSQQVFEVASSDLVNMGITVVSYTLKDIRDEEVNQFEESQMKALKDLKRPLWNLVKARNYLQLPLRQWGAGNVYLLVLSS